MESFTLTQPPDFITEGLLYYAAAVIIGCLLIGQAKLMILLLAAGLVPVLALSMPRVAYAIGCVAALVVFRRYGWRWTLLVTSYLAATGYLVLRNLEDLGALKAAAPPLFLGALADAVISSTLLMAFAVVAWFFLLFAKGKAFALLRGGLGGERSRRLPLAEVQALRTGRQSAGHWFLGWASGGRYQTPAQKQAAASQARTQQAQASRRARATQQVRQKLQLARAGKRPAPASARPAGQRARARQRQYAAGKGRP